MEESDIGAMSIILLQESSGSMFLARQAQRGPTKLPLLQYFSALDAPVDQSIAHVAAIVGDSFGRSCMS